MDAEVASVLGAVAASAYFSKQLSGFVGTVWCRVAAVTGVSVLAEVAEVSCAFDDSAYFSISVSGFFVGASVAEVNKVHQRASKDEQGASASRQR